MLPREEKRKAMMKGRVVSQTPLTCTFVFVQHSLIAAVHQVAKTCHPEES